MTVTDPIADLLTRIRNANMVNHANVLVPSSNLKLSIVKLLLAEGYIAGFDIEEKDGFKMINIELKYIDNKPVIKGLERVSTPGLRTYSKAKNLPRVFGGLGIAIVSTSKGLMTDKLARKENLGGEILCNIW